MYIDGVRCSAAYADLEHVMATLPSDRAAARASIADAVNSIGPATDLAAAQLPDQADKIE